jgi:hypothetical protein
MDAGTVTLVIYLAGMGPAPRDPFPYLWITFPNLPRVHVPLHHPLAVTMRSLEACEHVAKRERARGHKALCYENKEHDRGPSDYWPHAPRPG